jgi:hypothetical protein
MGAGRNRAVEHPRWRADSRVTPMLRAASVGFSLALASCAEPGSPPAGLLLLGGALLDGTGAEAMAGDLAVTGDRITFIGDAREAGVEARDTLDASGLLVTPGFVDMHSHAELDEAYGREVGGPGRGWGR